MKTFTSCGQSLGHFEANDTSKNVYIIRKGYILTIDNHVFINKRK